MLYGKTEMFFNAQHENIKSYYIYNLDGSDQIDLCMQLTQF